MRANVAFTPGRAQPLHTVRGRHASRSCVCRVHESPKQERRGGREWLHTMLSRFDPIAEKGENTAVLDFEKPLAELDSRIKEVIKLGLSVE